MVATPNLGDTTTNGGSVRQFTLAHRTQEWPVYPGRSDEGLAVGKFLGKYMKI